MTVRRNRTTATALRVVVVGLFVVGQAKSEPGFGLTGPALTVTLLTTALALAASYIIFTPTWTHPLSTLFHPLPQPTNPPPPNPVQPPTNSPHPPTRSPQPLTRSPHLPSAPPPPPASSPPPLSNTPHPPTSSPPSLSDTPHLPSNPPHPLTDAQPPHAPPPRPDGPAPTSPSEAQAPHHPSDGSEPDRSSAEASLHWLSDLPVKAVLLCVCVVLALLLDATSSGGPAMAAMFACVAIAAVRLPVPHAIPVGITAVLGLLIAGSTAGRVDRDLSLILAVGLVFAGAYSIKERRAVRAAEGREAVLAERARIAREIHDVLAHSLSAQIVHLEGAKLLLRAERNEEALDRVVRARDLAKSGLEEARRAVSALREDTPGLPITLKTLATEFEEATEQPCTLTITGPERRLPPETELAMTRTAQESLTNIRRHAPGSPATIHVTYAPQTCTLDITNPLGSERGTPGGGYGLVGMRERAELLGGTLTTTESNATFHVHLQVPT